MPVVFHVTRARATFAVGLLRLRRLPAVALEGAAALAVVGIQKATTHAAGIAASATLAAAVAKETTHAAPLSANAVLAAYVTKTTGHSAALAAAAALAVAGIQKATTHAAAVSAAATLRARVQTAGDTLCFDDAEAKAFSDGETAAYVTVSL